MNTQRSLSDAYDKIRTYYPEYSTLMEIFVNKENKKLKKNSLKTPVLIIAGGASLMNKTKVNEYYDMLLKLMCDFKGTIISGGTTSGIPGLVGQIKTELDKNNKVEFDLLGYLPQSMPDNVNKSQSYDYLFETDSNEFSVLEVLNYWTDIILSGNEPGNVILFGIDGGEISMLEYKIALLLGAKVCLVEGSGRAADELLQDKNLYKNHNLFAFTKMPVSYNSLLTIINKTSHV